MKITNEKFVIVALQNLHGAQTTFQASAGNGNYGTLEQLRNQNFIDPVLATGEKYSYLFTITVVPASPGQPAAFQISVVPVRYGKGGRWSFFTNETGAIRGADRNGEPATVNDTPVFTNCGEIGAISSLRAIISAEFTYRATVGNGNYGGLNQLADAGLINTALGQGLNCGYYFGVTAFNFFRIGERSFNGYAIPIAYGSTGIRSFYFDQTGIIRGADRGGDPANADDPPIE